MQWSGSPFTSRLVSSTLHVSGVIRTFEVRKLPSDYWPQAIGIDLILSRADVFCSLDDGSKIFNRLLLVSRDGAKQSEPHKYN